MLFDKQKKQAWRETSLKGRMAESLVYDLLQESQNQVYRIGYEAILPGLASIEESFRRRSIVGEKIRAIPDFFVIDKSGTPHLVEVKFRWNSEGHANDLPKFERIRNNWQEAIIIFVNCSQKPYFRSCPYPFTDVHNKVITAPLQAFNAFGISNDLVDKFDVLVEKYLRVTLDDTHRDTHN